MPAQSSLSLPERRFLAVVVLAGFLSTISAFLLLVVLLYRAVGKPKIPLTAIKIFFMWLLFWDVFEGIGALLSVRWVHHGAVISGNYCIAQASIKQLSATGTAFSIMAMAICILYEYVIDIGGRQRPWTREMAVCGIGVISLVQIVDLAIPNGVFHGASRYYGTAGYWCWISDDHFATKIVSEYLWFWVAWVCSFLTSIAFGLSAHKQQVFPAGFLWIGYPLERGRMLRIGLVSVDSNSPDNVRGRVKWSFSVVEVTVSSRTVRVMVPVPVQILTGVRAHSDNRRAKQNTDHAFKLLWFPLAYLVLIGPLSVVRFLYFTGRSPGYKANMWAALIFGLSGLVDVVLYNWAKPAFGVRDEDDEP